jgi:hypothetical protein
LIERDGVYNREQVSSVIGKTEDFVQFLWDNWHAGNTPRMNNCTRRGPARQTHSTGGEIQQYLDTDGGRRLL